MSAPIIPPAGISPAGTWQPSETEYEPVRPPVLLADDIDPATGELASMTSAPHPVDAAIREAFRILQGSGAAVRNVGHRFDKVKKLTERTPRELRDECERILKPFVDRRDIDVIRIEIDTTGQGSAAAAGVVDYLNRHTARRERVRTP